MCGDTLTATPAITAQAKSNCRCRGRSGRWSRASSGSDARWRRCRPDIGRDARPRSEVEIAVEQGRPRWRSSPLNTLAQRGAGELALRAVVGGDVGAEPAGLIAEAGADHPGVVELGAGQSGRGRCRCRHSRPTRWNIRSSRCRRGDTSRSRIPAARVGARPVGDCRCRRRSAVAGTRREQRPQGENDQGRGLHRQAPNVKVRIRGRPCFAAPAPGSRHQCLLILAHHRRARRWPPSAQRSAQLDVVGVDVARRWCGLLRAVGAAAGDHVAGHAIAEVEVAVGQLDGEGRRDVVGHAGMQRPGEVPPGVIGGVGGLIRTACSAGGGVAIVADRHLRRADADADERRELAPRAEVDIGVEQEQPLRLVAVYVVGAVPDAVRPSGRKRSIARKLVLPRYSPVTSVRNQELNW